MIKRTGADTYFDDSKTVGPATLNVWTANNTYTTFEALATYEKQIKNHTFKLLAGTSVEQSNNKGLEGYRNTFPNNYLYELGSGDKQQLLMIVHWKNMRCFLFSGV